MRRSDSPFSSPTSLGALSDDLQHVAQDIPDPATWQIRCVSGHNSISGISTREKAIEVACRLMDNGFYVISVGSGSGEDELERQETERVCAIWAKVRHY